MVPRFDIRSRLGGQVEVEIRRVASNRGVIQTGGPLSGSGSSEGTEIVAAEALIRMPCRRGRSRNSFIRAGNGLKVKVKVLLLLGRAA